MSLIGYLLRKTGAYDRLQNHFVEALLPPFAMHGQVSTAERGFLGELARGLHGNGPIIEVGTLFGSSTKVLAANKDPSRKLITVDNYVWNPCGIPRQQHLTITSKILEECISKQNVEQRVIDKNAFYATYRGPAPVMVFLDADHSYEETLKDIQWAKSAGAGLISGHDYAPHIDGVVRAVQESGGTAALVDTLWVLRQ
jgi:predicted O-methyltransferase YrrM